MNRQYFDPRNWPTALLLAMLWLTHTLLPYKVSLRLYGSLGRLAYYGAFRLRKIMQVNIGICFPEMDAAARKNLIKRNFEQWAISLVEIGLSWWGDSEGVLDNVNYSGTEHLDKAVAEGNGVIILGLHFSTFELGSLLMRKHLGPDTPLHIIYRDQNNPLLNAKMAKGRLRHVDGLIEKKDTRSVIKIIRARKLIWFSTDQDHGRKNSVYAPFFGHPAATLRTTSTLAKFRGAAVLVMGTYRNQDNRGYSVRISPAIEDFPSGDDLLDATRVNALVEEAIRVAPDQYMWFHRRFKSQPDLPKAALYK